MLSGQKWEHSAKCIAGTSCAFMGSNIMQRKAERYLRGCLEAYLRTAETEPATDILRLRVRKLLTDCDRLLGPQSTTTRSHHRIATARQAAAGLFRRSE